VLNEIVGSEPTSTDTPMHTAVARLVKPILESQRNLRKLKRAGVDPDAAVAVLCNLEFYASLLPSAKRRRRGGTFVDEVAAAKLAGGGVCLNTTQMKQLMEAKEAERVAKAVAKQAATAMKQQAKKAKQDALAAKEKAKQDALAAKEKAKQHALAAKEDVKSEHHS